MYEQLISVVDGFFDSPSSVRDLALSLEYKAPMSQLHANQLGPIALYASCADPVRNSTIDKLRKFLPADVADAHIEFCYCHSGTIKRQAAADSFDFAGVVYLTLPEHCQGLSHSAW